MSILPGGVVITGFLSPTDTLDIYPTHLDIYGQGGHHTVVTLSERDALTILRRKEGMTCYVKENQSYYTLHNGIDNSNWKLLYYFVDNDLQVSINLPEDYILMGDVNGNAVPSPSLIDLRLDLMLTRQADYLVGHPSLKLPNAQVLSNLADGVLVNTGGTISTIPNGGGGLGINLTGDVTGIGLAGGSIPTTLTLTLDQIKEAIDTVDLNEQKIENLNSIVDNLHNAINYEFVKKLVDGTLPSSAVARIGYIVSNLEIDTQTQRFVFGNQPLPYPLGGIRLDNVREPLLLSPTETILALGNKYLSGYRFNHITDINLGIGDLRLESFVNNTIVDILRVKNNNLDLYTHRITNAGDPVDLQDYVTLAYFNAHNTGGSGGITTLTGAVIGTSMSSVLDTVLNSIINMSTSREEFRFNNIDNSFILKNSFAPTTGNDTSLSFTFENSYDQIFNITHRMSFLGNHSLSISHFEPSSGPLESTDIVEFLYSSIALGYISNFKSTVKIDGTSFVEVAALYVIGGKINVPGESSSIRATSSNDCTKIEINNSKLGGQGKLYELRSDQFGSFGITNRTDNIDNFKILSNGDILFNGTCFSKGPGALVIMQDNTLGTFITIGPVISLVGNMIPQYLNKFTFSGSTFTYIGSETILADIIASIYYTKPASTALKFYIIKNGVVITNTGSPAANGSSGGVLSLINTKLTLSTNDTITLGIIKLGGSAFTITISDLSINIFTT